MSATSSRDAVRLVAMREFTTRVRTRAFVISVAVTLVIIVGGMVAASLFNGDSARTVVVTGQAAPVEKAVTAAADALDVDIEVSTADSESTARAEVADGDTDVALLPQDGGAITAVTKDEIGSELRAVVESAAQQLALEAALEAQDVDAEQFGRDLASAQVDVDVLDPSDPDKDQRLVLAYVAVFLLFFTVYLYGLYVAMGVVEEKSSRVVELLLSTIKPLDLLIGKVLGIGAVGLVQVVAFGGVGLVAGILTDVVTVQGTAVTLFGVVILWYVLGFAFFAILYAGLGSLVSRQEDVNSSTMPLSILAFASFFAAQSALSDPSSSWISVLAWVPPFSATVVPMRVAAGVSSPAEAIGSVVVMLVAIAVAAVFAARVYENSVLNTGGRQSLRSALNR